MHVDCLIMRDTFEVQNPLAQKNVTMALELSIINLSEHINDAPV